MKKIFTFIGLLVFAMHVNATNPTDDEVIALVTQTAVNLENQPKEVLMEIFKEKPPYQDANNRDLKAYVLRTNGVIEVHPDKRLSGRPCAEFADADGKKYIMEIVKNALDKENKEGTGWVTYTLKYPNQTTIQRKIYFKLVEANNTKYIVCSDKAVN
jgi:hypothetical protein